MELKRDKNKQTRTLTEFNILLKDTDKEQKEYASFCQTTTGCWNCLVERGA